MPVINKEHFSLRDAIREVHYNNPTIMSSGPSGLGLRSSIANANSSYFDPYYNTGGLRRFRNYHKEDGIYVYEIMQNVCVPNMYPEGGTHINEDTGSTYAAFPIQSYWIHRIMHGGQVYFTLPGFLGWHVPTEKELDLTIAACGGINNAGYYLKQHPVEIIHPPQNKDYWKDSEERCPDYDRDLGLLPGGTMNLYTEEWVKVGEMANYLYFKYQSYDTLSYNNPDWEQNHSYSADTCNKPVITMQDSGTYYQGKTRARPIKNAFFDVLKLTNTSNAVQKHLLYQGGQPPTAVQIRLVRDPDFDMTSHTDFNGNEYETITIGGVVWMKQDLRATQLGYTFDHREKNVINVLNKYLQVVEYKQAQVDPTYSHAVDFNPGHPDKSSKMYWKQQAYVMPYLGIQHHDMNLDLIYCNWDMLFGSQFAYPQTNFGFKIVQPYISYI